MDYTDEYLIEQYLEDALTEAEEALFKKRLEDADFKKAVREEVEIAAVLKEKFKADFKQELDIAIEQTAIKQKKQRRKLLLFGIGIIALLSAAYFLWKGNNTNQAPTNEQIFAQYYQKPPATIERSATDEATIIAINIAYANENYEEVIELLTPYLESKSQEHNGRLMLIHAYQATANYNLALNNVSFLIENTDQPTLQQTASWYQALIFIKQNRKEEAINMLEELKREGIYQKQAEEILEVISD